MAMAATCDEPCDRECSICHELLTTPKLLPCGHHLCRHCLVSWIQSKTDAPCPLCRCAIMHPEDNDVDVEAETVVDALPTDLFMEKLAEAEYLLSKDHSCRVCEDVAATALCLQCRDMLCTACKKAHKKLSLGKSHVVEDLASLTAEKLACTRPSACEAHPEETCKLYCPSHATSVCLLCAFTKHRACSDLVELSDQTEEETRLMEGMVEDLDAREKEIDEDIDLLDLHLEKIKSYANAAMAKIAETRRRLESSVRVWEQRLREQIQKECAYVEAAVQETKEPLFRRRGTLSTHKDVARQGQRMTDRVVVDKMVTVLKKRIEQVESTSAVPADVKVISSLELLLDEEAVSRLEQELSRLGQVSVCAEEITGIVKLPAFSFHENHGGRVRLSNFGRTVTKAGGLQNGRGIVMASEPMRRDLLYEVQIVYQYVAVGKKRHQLETLAVGVVAQTPDSLSLPDSASDLLCAYVLSRDCIQKPESEVSVAWGPESDALKSLGVGDRVGLALDSDSRLHLFLNAQHQGMIAPDVPHPCYALFELREKAAEITALPLTRVAHR